MYLHCTMFNAYKIHIRKCYIFLMLLFGLHRLYLGFLFHSEYPLYVGYVGIEHMQNEIPSVSCDAWSSKMRIRKFNGKLELEFRCICTINALHLDANVGYRTIDDDDDTHHAHIQTQKHTHASLHTYNGMCGVHIHTQRVHSTTRTLFS